MSTHYEYDKGFFGKFSWEPHIHCDRCRIEIELPFLGHKGVFGYDDLCCGCYGVVYQGGNDKEQVVDLGIFPTQRVQSYTRVRPDIKEQALRLGIFVL
jgi:hypothetical protein